MKFTDFHDGSTVCAPSRCVLMTELDMGIAPVMDRPWEHHFYGTKVPPRF